MVPFGHYSCQLSYALIYYILKFYSIFELFTEGAVAMAFYDKPTHIDDESSNTGTERESVEGDGAEPLEEASAEGQFRQELDSCKQEVNDLKETCKRVAADFENFKKRVERDRISWTQSAQAELLRDILPIVDDFDRALLEYQKTEGQIRDESWIAGFQLIRKSLNKLLQTYGVTQVEQLTNFDPEFHEAVTQVESPTHQSGDVVEVVHKGYMFNGRLLRAARVIVAK